MVGHWEVYFSRERSTGKTPWAIVGFELSKHSAVYASTVVIRTNSYTGIASRKDRPQHVVHAYGELRRSGDVIYIEVPGA